MASIDEFTIRTKNYEILKYFHGKAAMNAARRKHKREDPSEVM
jgi:hypothetical protein